MKNCQSFAYDIFHRKNVVSFDIFGHNKIISPGPQSTVKCCCKNIIFQHLILMIHRSRSLAIIWLLLCWFTKSAFCSQLFVWQTKRTRNCPITPVERIFSDLWENLSWNGYSFIMKERKNQLNLGPRPQIGVPKFQNWIKLVSWDVLWLEPTWTHTDPASSDCQTPKTPPAAVFG